MKKFFVLAALLVISVAAHAEKRYMHDLARPEHPDLVLGKSVGRIRVGGSVGTGFLVAPNKILSNHHVIGGVGKQKWIEVRMGKHQADGPVHGYITEVIYAVEHHDMAVGIVNWTHPGFVEPAPLALMSASEFDARVQFEKRFNRGIRIKTIGHPGAGPKTRQVGNYVRHTVWKVGHYPAHKGGSSGSPAFFENGNVVIGIVSRSHSWTESHLFHDQHPDHLDYFDNLMEAIESPLGARSAAAAWDDLKDAEK